MIESLLIFAGLLILTIIIIMGLVIALWYVTELRK